MTDPPPLSFDAYSLVLERRGVRIDSLSVDEKGTICATPPPPSRPPPLVAVQTNDGDEIVVKRHLSAGGMGEVLLAEQTSIGRDVAVKRASQREAQHDLVVEGRVAGRLEHPNIAPVYLLGRDKDGAPLLVMKRIEGRTWAELLAAGVDLGRDVGILIDVCAALRFAHARGVVHRDVKPQNVMVGSFGEVYLVDWGVAAAIGPEAPPELPRASEQAVVIGTPAYMAPEMALATAEIDARTDVFLVGAVLFELLAGAPPFRRDKLSASLLAAARTELSPLPADAPAELADICRRALAPEKAARYPDIDASRDALRAFQSHAAARELCREAEARLEKLRALDPDADPRVRLELFHECRFGFTQALRIWPESAAARRGVQIAIETMARHQIAAGHYDSAALLVLVPEDVAAGLAALHARRAREAESVAELARVARESDRSFAQRERARLLVGYGVGGMTVCLSLGLLDSRGVYHATSSR